MDLTQIGDIRRDDYREIATNLKNVVIPKITCSLKELLACAQAWHAIHQEENQDRSGEKINSPNPEGPSR